MRRKAELGFRSLLPFLSYEVIICNHDDDEQTTNHQFAFPHAYWWIRRRRWRSRRRRWGWNRRSFRRRVVSGPLHTSLPTERQYAKDGHPCHGMYRTRFVEKYTKKSLDFWCTLHILLSFNTVVI